MKFTIAFDKKTHEKLLDIQEVLEYVPWNGRGIEEEIKVIKKSLKDLINLLLDDEDDE